MKQFIIQIIKRNYLLKNIYWHHRLRRDAKIVFKKFGIAGDLNAEFEKIKTAHALFGWLPDEFYLYHYESLSDIERKSFICEDEHVDVTDFLNTKTARIILSDKWNTYNAFHKFFDRKACYIANNKEDGEWETLFGLFNDFGALIIKPINSSFGKGIQIIENSSNKIYNDY